MRAGAFALSLLAEPLNVQVLEKLDEGPCSSLDLRRSLGAPPETTLRNRLRALADGGVLERTRRPGFAGTLDYELAPPGKRLLRVADVLRDWLAAAPDGPLHLGVPAAKSSVEALAEGWSRTIVRALAAKPLSLTELNRLLPRSAYPSLQRRLGAMRLAGLIEAAPGRSRGTPYAVTEWLRRAVAPLAVAARWEDRHARAATSRPGTHDIEAAFLLALPLVRLDPELSGSCRLAVAMNGGAADGKLSGVDVELAEGRVISLSSCLEGRPDNSAVGDPCAWISTVVDGDHRHLELGGDRTRARELAEGLHVALFSIALTPLY